MVPGRSAAALETWLGKQEPNFRSRIQRIAMDGFAGYHRAAADAIPQARTVMDPFHVVHLAAEKMNLCRQRVQQETTGHRGRSEIGRAHVCTPVTFRSRMPSSARKKK